MVFSRISEYVKLIRAYQWYKNLLVFVPLIFAGLALDMDLFGLVLLGFVALCLVSSAGYVINDLFDRKKDRLHPEKRHRPLAAKTVSPAEAVALAALLLAAGGFLSFKIGLMFFLSAAALFIFTLAYSLGLKNEPVLDVIIIAINFVIRATSGAWIVRSFNSPWLVLCPFFLALFLALVKRGSDAALMERKRGSKEAPTLSPGPGYSPEVLSSLLDVSTACLILVYALYALSRSSLFLLSIPVAIYAVFRFYHLGMQGSEIARQAHKVYKDWRIMLSIIIWIAIISFIIYLAEPIGLVTYLRMHFI